MRHLVKLNMIAGGLVLILAVVLGSVIAEFAIGLGQTNSRKPGTQPEPGKRPGVQVPLRPGLPAVANSQNPMELVLL
jgi:hypothetical protein